MGRVVWVQEGMTVEQAPDTVEAATALDPRLRTLADSLQGGRARKSLADLVAEQGTAETSTYDWLLGKGEDLWADDAEFDAFLDHLRRRRGHAG